MYLSTWGRGEARGPRTQQSTARPHCRLTRVSCTALVPQAYANSHGGDTLTNADLKTIFK
jgi:hypothetical protein